MSGDETWERLEADADESGEEFLTDAEIRARDEPIVLTGDEENALKCAMGMPWFNRFMDPVQRVGAWSALIQQLLVDDDLTALNEGLLGENDGLTESLQEVEEEMDWLQARLAWLRRAYTKLNIARHGLAEALDSAHRHWQNDVRELQNSTTEWAIFDREGELHRGPWSEAEAREWLEECVEMGIKTDVFHLRRRTVGRWRPLDPEEDA